MISIFILQYRAFLVKIPKHHFTSNINKICGCGNEKHDTIMKAAFYSKNLGYVGPDMNEVKWKQTVDHRNFMKKKVVDVCNQTTKSLMCCTFVVFRGSLHLTQFHYALGWGFYSLALYRSRSHLKTHKARIFISLLIKLQNDGYIFINYAVLVQKNLLMFRRSDFEYLVWFWSLLFVFQCGFGPSSI